MVQPSIKYNIRLLTLCVYVFTASCEAAVQ